MAGESILVVGPNLTANTQLDGALASDNRLVSRAPDVASALKEMAARLFHVIIAEADVLGQSPTGALERLRTADPDASILIVSDSARRLAGASVSRLGAAGCLVKPLDPTSVQMALETALFQRKLVQENRALKRQLRELFTFNDWVGATGVSQEVRAAISAAALGSGPVLLLGEAGTGRRLAAELIHYNGPEADGTFLPIDLHGLPAGELTHLLSELKDGTPVARPRPAAALANSGARPAEALAKAGSSLVTGSLYLSELSALAPVDQGALFEFLGSRTPLRLLASAAPDLVERVESGAFHEPLFRLASARTLALPTLRERSADIPLLIDHFLRRFCERLNVRKLAVSHHTIEQLIRYHWPGNVAELAMVIERAISIASAAKLDGTTLPDQFCQPPTLNVPEPTSLKGQSLKELISDMEKRIIIQTLESVAGSQKRAAQMLRLKPTTLHEKMKRYKILPDKVRSPFRSFVVSS